MIRTFAKGLREAFASMGCFTLLSLLYVKDRNIDISAPISKFDAIVIMLLFVVSILWSLALKKYVEEQDD